MTKYSIGAHARARTVTPCEGDLDSLIDALDVTDSRVHADDYAAMSKSERNQIKLSLPYFVGGTFDGSVAKKSMRSDSALTGRSLLTLDVEAKGAQDHPPHPREVARVAYREAVDCWIYSTPSHRPEAPRYRVVVSVRAPLPGGDGLGEALKAETLAAAERLGIREWTQPESWVPAQAMFGPLQLRGGELFTRRVTGRPWKCGAAKKPEPAKPGKITEPPVETESMAAARRAKGDPVLDAIKAAGLYLDDAGQGKHYIRCPFADEHGMENDTQTVYWEAHTNGFAFASVKCLDTEPDDDGEPHLTMRTLTAWLVKQGHMSKDEADSLPGAPDVLTDDALFDELSSLDGYFKERPAPRSFVLDKIAPRGKATVIGGSGGSGKTGLVVQALAHAACGEAFGPFVPERETRSLVLAYEDDRDEIARRLWAVTEGLAGGDPLKAEIVRAKVAKRMRAVSLDGLHPDRYRIMARAQGDRWGTPERTPAVDAIIKRCQREGIDALVLDPVNLTHGLEESDNGAMGAYMQTLNYIAREADCAVIVLHHRAKGGDDGVDHVGASSLRGASALADNARSVAMVTGISVQDAARFGLPEDREALRGYAVLTHVKHNYSASAGQHVFEYRQGAWLPRPDLRAMPKDEAKAKVAEDKRAAALREEAAVVRHLVAAGGQGAKVYGTAPPEVGHLPGDVIELLTPPPISASEWAALRRTGLAAGTAAWPMIKTRAAVTVWAKENNIDLSG